MNFAKRECVLQTASYIRALKRKKVNKIIGDKPCLISKPTYSIRHSLWKMPSGSSQGQVDTSPDPYGNDSDDDIYNQIDVRAMIGDDNEDDNNEQIIFSDNEDGDGDEMEVDEVDPDAIDLAAEFSEEDDNQSFEEDDEEAFMDAVREANNFRVKKRGDRKRPRARPQRELDPEVILLLSRANELFVASDYEAAEKVFLEVIKKDPRNFAAYKSLGEIYLIQNRKNKSCNAWFLAAHLNPLDGEFWEIVAKASRDLGHTTQAIYCYGRAISGKNKSFEVLLQRAILYRETGQLGRALEGLQKLQKSFPSRSAVVRELALIYIQLNRVNDAIAMYLKIFERNVSKRRRDESNEDSAFEDSDEEDSKSRGFPIFDWSSLNILAELFVKQKNYAIAIRTIKHAARWIQGREAEEFWEDVADDSEFDERRYENSKFEALPDVLKTRSHKLPIDIRVKLGSLRLSLNHVDEALVHFGFLLNEDITEMSDLFSDAGTKLEEAQLFNDAVKFYLPLSRLDEFHIPELFTSLGRCLTELGKYQDAKEHYNIALQLDPDNMDIQLALVEVLYYLEEVDESQRLLESITSRRKNAEKAVIDEEDSLKANEMDFEQEGEHQALIQNKIIKPPKRGYRLTEAEKHARDNKLKQNVIEKYQRLKRLHQGLEAGDSVAASTWIQLASELIEIFSNVKNFFPKDRSRQFKGIITRTRNLQMDIDSKIERISQLYEGFTSKVEEKLVLTSKEEFRGLTYDQWFELFMEYALAVARYENPNDANSIIDSAKNVNVFYHNSSRDETMNLVKLAISIRTQDHKDMLLSLRVILNSFQFNKKVLKLFLLCQPSGKLCTENFISINHQKYFLRQVKAYNSLNLKRSITGMANITNKDVEVDGNDNTYLMYIYACLLFTNRSYVPSLVYFTRIYKSYKNEPIICFLAGLAHVHRSMQRSSTNRHLELLQGLKYVMEYFELRTSSKFGRMEYQEALYNLARVYHLLGLFSIAVEYYDKVLNEFDDLDPEEDLKRQTAYNLVLIYNSSGNTKLSNKIMEEYLTI